MCVLNPAEITRYTDSDPGHNVTATPEFAWQYLTPYRYIEENQLAKAAEIQGSSKNQTQRGGNSMELMQFWGRADHNGNTKSLILTMRFRLQIRDARHPSQAMARLHPRRNRR